MGHAWSGEEPRLFADVLRASVADRPLPAVLTEVPGAAPDTGDGQRLTG